MNDKDRRVDAGQYVERDWRGHIKQVAPQRPDAILCRRLVDYPNGEAPAGADLDTCQKCSALVAYNPNGPHQDRPRICMQCGGIEPLPMEADHGPR